MNAHFKFSRYFIISEPFIVVQINSVLVVCRVIARGNVFIVVRFLVGRRIVRHCVGVTAVRISEREGVCGIERLAFAVKLFELSVMATMRLASFLVDAEPTNNAVVVRKVAPLCVRKFVPDLRARHVTQRRIRTGKNK